jgi:hypothetical protein
MTRVNPVAKSRRATMVSLMPHGMVFEFDRGSQGVGGGTMGWLDALLDTIACATAARQRE